MANKKSKRSHSRVKKIKVLAVKEIEPGVQVVNIELEAHDAPPLPSGTLPAVVEFTDQPLSVESGWLYSWLKRIRW